MALVIIKPPAMEPVTLIEAKLHLRIDHSDEDAHSSSLITAAREYAEAFQRRQFISATWRLFLDGFPAYGGVITLPRPPLQCVLSVRYIDGDGETQTLEAGTDYEVDLLNDPGRVRPAYGTSWPSTANQLNAVWVDFVAGYATKVTAAASTDLVTCDGDRVLASGDLVRFHTTAADLPAPLAVFTDYYARDVSGTSFKVSLTSGGDAVNILDAGTASHTIGEVPRRVAQAILLLVGHWYEHRESVVIGTITKEVEQAVDSLLWQERVL